MGRDSLFKRLSFYHYLLNLLLIGCIFNEESEVIDRNGYFYIVPKPSHIDAPSVSDWPVGPLGRVVISKGFLFRVNLPYIPTHYLRRLIDEHEIDSWIVNVRRKSYGSNKSLEHLYIPIVNEASLAIKGSSSYRMTQKKTFVLRIYYADAAMSDRFEGLMCPALGHNLALKDADLLKRKSFQRFITIRSKIGVPFNRKVLKYNISNNKINGGKSLLGEYSIEVALYSFKKKRIFSNFYDLKNVIKVSVERPKAIKGCSNFKIPEKDEEATFPLKFLKF